nr:MAG TPA: hypothetical protein [Caudoviricetes sp.]
MVLHLDFLCHKLTSPECQILHPKWPVVLLRASVARRMSKNDSPMVYIGFVTHTDTWPG